MTTAGRAAAPASILIEDVSAATTAASVAAAAAASASAAPDVVADGRSGRRKEALMDWAARLRIANRIASASWRSSA